MLRAERLIAATVLVALSCVLSGCGTNGSFDPTDAMDWFDTKKKLPGDRRSVFPEGVPGVEQGVPKELYKGAAQQEQDQPPVVAAPTPEPKSKKGGSKSASRRPNSVAPSEQQPAPEAALDAAQEADDNAVAAAPPAPPPKKQKRRSITAPDADVPQAQSRPAAAQAPQQQSAAPFPAPLPSGGFQR